MRWPWVSRERLDEKTAEIAELKAEVRELRAVLYGGARGGFARPFGDRDLAQQREMEALESMQADAARVVAADRAEIREPERSESEGAPVSFTTPFDRIEKNCAAAIAAGGIGARYRAKV